MSYHKKHIVLYRFNILYFIVRSFNKRNDYQLNRHNY